MYRPTFLKHCQDCNFKLISRSAMVAGLSAVPTGYQLIGNDPLIFKQRPPSNDHTSGNWLPESISKQWTHQEWVFNFNQQTCQLTQQDSSYQSFPPINLPANSDLVSIVGQLSVDAVKCMHSITCQKHIPHPLSTNRRPWIREVPHCFNLKTDNITPYELVLYFILINNIKGH